MDEVISVNHASIRYLVGDFRDIGIKEYFTRKLRNQYHIKEFWADKDLTFSVRKGELLGIIGTNGAGKSTILKAISGIMEPSEGSITVRGKICSLLELTGGFDEDMNLRENIYLRGAFLGFSKGFLNEKYDHILEFSELQGFEDLLFKNLSSGMKSRLAFSVASLLEPEVLILDEVLSVGDGAFRKKSEDKMKEIINGGATTILVSHSLSQIRALSTKVLWLHKGRQIEFGEDVQGICDRYEAMLNGDLQITLPE